MTTNTNASGHTSRSAIRRGLMAIGATATALLVLPGVAHADDDHDDRGGAVYTATNSPAGNEVLAFSRSDDGQLTPAGSYPTGGTGTGAGLGSQGSVTLTDDGRYLLVVNAGSDDVSAFRVRRDGLELVNTVPTGGDTPTSVTADHDDVFVLNAGSATISGFHLGRHGLEPVPGSSASLSTTTGGPGQVGFAPDGKQIVVTLRAANAFDVFRVGRHGNITGPVTTASNGPTPFGFDFDRRGRIVVANANAGVALGSSASSYQIGRDGVLGAISGPVPTTQTAACWLVVTGDGRYAYTTNAASASISGYRIGRDGTLTLISPVTGATGNGAVDVALSRDSRFVYNVNQASDTISMFEVAADGTLVSIGSMTGVPATALGIAAS